MVWTVQVAGGAATRVDFAIDGKARSSLKIQSGASSVRTYTYGGSGGSLDTTKLANGVHRLKATTSGKGATATAQVTVTVANEPVPTPGAPTSVSPPVVRGDAVECDFDFPRRQVSGLRRR